MNARRSLADNLWVGACGALGGAINAGLCYADLPVTVGGVGGKEASFAWHIVPAGAIHGGLLAAVALGVGKLVSKRNLSARIVAAVPIAWIAGFVSWIPLHRSALDKSWAKSLIWPFTRLGSETVVYPIQYFGLVAGLYYLFIALGCTRERSLGTHLGYAIASGTLGSLWFWLMIEPWYFSLLHGAIWGILVGTSTWATSRSRATIVPSVA